MANFAKLGINGKVIQVVTFDDNRMLNADGIEDEEIGRQELERETGWPLWKQYSYNTLHGTHRNGKTPFRATSASIGMFYNEELDIFYSKRPEGYDSWTFNIEKGLYEPPTPQPPWESCQYIKDGVSYKYMLSWNDNTKKWEGLDSNNIKIVIWNGTSWNTV